ncbi:MAG: class I SAM-dependent DNA methyltransferase, partial [Ruminococcus sp.]|nr:class I SAM-dependent DNA methyltransferase [Ruminococcus sp.]
EEIVEHDLDFLPLKSYANITEANALRIDWENVVPKEKLSYIMGNPPFVGYSLQSKEQKADILSIYVDENGKPYKTAGKIDYVAGWYFKASSLMHSTGIQTAFVSTNSITQGEQVASVWKPLCERFGVSIDFAYRNFRWDSEASLKAHVHCVIVGFSTMNNNSLKKLYNSDNFQLVKNVSPYLISTDNIFIESRKKPICNVSEMVKGSIPVDDGNFFLTAEEKSIFLKAEPQVQKYIKKFYGAREFLHNEERWCLWLLNATPNDLKSMPKVMERVKNIKNFRLKSTKLATQKFADYPTRFMEIRQPTTEYIIIPSHSSENRRYIPIGFENADVICGNANFLVPNATLYEFGILASNVHMAWTRTVCGRLKSDYRYSNTVVYNNFPFPNPTPEQHTRIERTASAILNARNLYPTCTLADLYDELTMPPELRKAHQANDIAVMTAYSFDRKITESECVAELMKLYQKLTSGN